MKIEINAQPKEIAALVLALQRQQLEGSEDSDFDDKKTTEIDTALGDLLNRRIESRPTV